MPILAPGFRELNHKRITQLAKEGLSPQTIAGVIRDETQSDVKLNAADIRSYLKIQDYASKRMLISQRTMRALRREQQSLNIVPV
ncbi:hypothetical protein HBO13_30175 [Pseudomonas lactis]|uniref:Uncharacterized protein n=1 Tax=Pseudomonas lactis TaxID=1615674 RepID=A0A7Y1M806_9PSED|nr:hypothetical protein [Pseudomonas lactis]NNA76904.1 hypothetical protein [Pseudomonas lactis]